MSGIDNLFSQVPIIGGVFDDSGDKAMDLYRQNQKLYGGLQTPVFSKYNPVAFDPTLAKATTVQQDPAIRQQQLSVLNRLGGLANVGLSDADNAGFNRAQNIGNQVENSGLQAALQNAEARGQSGSGMEYAMREMAASNAADRANQAGLNQADTAARQRAMYTQAFGNALGQQRSQDFGENAANSGILNQFALANTNTQNQAGMYNVGQQNYAQQYNNQMQQQQYNDQLSKLQGQAGANNTAANGYWGQEAANTAGRNSNTALLGYGLMGAFGGGAGAAAGAKALQTTGENQQTAGNDYTDYSGYA